ncbi:MAG: hypothetical protein JWQ66_3277 [Mucilaginibacter sp.]|nr:hypothetical protein [Mucilaginibacter sp.]
MKALNQLTNTDKAKLLHELFPDEIPTLLADIQAVCAHLKANSEAYAKTWDFGLMSFDMWLQLAEQADKLIGKHRTNMVKSSKVFSEQLFHSFDYTVLFVNDRIIKYAEGKSENSKFKLAVALLFAT